MKTRMDKYKDNESNVWALIYDQCSPELAKNKLKKTEGYEGAKGINGLVRILFRFRFGLFFWNLQEFTLFCSAEHTTELNHTRVFCTTCSKHLLRRHKKTGVNDGILLSAAAATVPRRKTLRCAAATAATQRQ